MKNLDSLVPSFKSKVVVFLNKLDTEKITYAIIETRRTQETQDAYYAQGRKPKEEINAMRSKIGLYLLGDDEAKRIVTQTKNSKHILGLAIDIIPTINNAPLWTVNTPEKIKLYKRMGEIGISCGLDWGGSWTPFDVNGLGWDLPHFQEKGLK